MLERLHCLDGIGQTVFRPLAQVRITINAHMPHVADALGNVRTGLTSNARLGIAPNILTRCGGDDNRHAPLVALLRKLHGRVQALAGSGGDKLQFNPFRGCNVILIHGYKIAHARGMARDFFNYLLLIINDLQTPYPINGKKTISGRAKGLGGG
jgi:hypothetical protein